MCHIEHEHIVSYMCTMSREQGSRVTLFMYTPAFISDEPVLYWIF